MCETASWKKRKTKSQIDGAILQDTQKPKEDFVCCNKNSKCALDQNKKAKGKQRIESETKITTLCGKSKLRQNAFPQSEHKGVDFKSRHETWSQSQHSPSF